MLAEIVTLVIRLDLLVESLRIGYFRSSPEPNQVKLWCVSKCQSG
jgi:hypothetical protein